MPILTSPEMGISVIASHLIIFWLSQDSNITPPVALGAYAGAAIARADPWKTGWACIKFAKLLYIMPLLFAYTHILFMEWDTHSICGFSGQCFYRNNYLCDYGDGLFCP